MNCTKTEFNTRHRDEVAEWLRRWTANPMGSARVGSNPILVGIPFILAFSLFAYLFHPWISLFTDGRRVKRFPLPGIEPGPAG